MPRVLKTVCLLTWCAFLSACGARHQGLRGLPDSVFLPEAEHRSSIETVGQLTRAHVANTMSLRRANAKIETICVAAGRCPETQE